MPKEPFDYTKKSAELEQIVEHLRRGDVTLDEATKLYSRGSALVKELETYLEKAENTVRTHAAGQ